MQVTLCGTGATVQNNMSGPTTSFLTS